MKDGDGHLDRKYEASLGAVWEAKEKDFLRGIYLPAQPCSAVEVLPLLPTRDVCVCMHACVSQRWGHSCSNDSEGLDIFYIFF